MNTKMTTELAAAHQLIGRELHFLYTKWNYFKRLFCTDDETVRLLQSAAAFFFKICDEVLLDDMILTICRLTDPPVTKVAGQEKANLTLSQIVALVPASDNSLVTNLKAELAALDLQSKKFREHRNRRIGHYDLDTRKRQPHARLPGFSLDEMELVLTNLAKSLSAPWSR